MKVQIKDFYSPHNSSSNFFATKSLKHKESVNPVWEAQILSHLNLTGSRPGFLINFNVPKIKHGIRRFVV